MHSDYELQKAELEMLYQERAYNESRHRYEMMKLDNEIAVAENRAANRETYGDMAG